MNLENVQRYDYGQITSVEMTAQGFLKVPGFATRTGVFTYRDINGNVRRELRHPDDVFAPESLATLKYIPVTLEHPPVMLDPTNVKQYTRGHATERVEVNRDLVETDLIVEDSAAIDAIVRDGKRELSCGYSSKLVEETGIFNGAEYDHRQKDIVYNHVAIVQRGRAGPEVRLRLDSADAVMEEADTTNDSESVLGPQVTKVIVISGQEVELPAGVADIIQALLDRYDDMRGQLMKMEEGMKKDADMKNCDVDVSQKNISPDVKVEQMIPDGRSAPAKVGAGDTSGAAKAKGDAEGAAPAANVAPQGEAVPAEPQLSPIEILKKELAEIKAMLGGKQEKIDEMQAKLDEYASKTIENPGKKMDSADKAIELRARERARLERQAEKLLPSETVNKFDTMSDDEIRAAVIVKRHPSAELSGKSTVYLQSRFDSIVETIAEGTSLRKEMGSHLLKQNHMDSERVNPEAKRREAIQASKDFWKESLSASKKK